MAAAGEHQRVGGVGLQRPQRVRDEGRLAHTWLAPDAEHRRPAAVEVLGEPGEVGLPAHEGGAGGGADRGAPLRAALDKRYA